ncbi:MAG TPA: PVC-type heme-binding CxxCH protein [Candidatus Limnocylindria bacterium]|jgi:putative heme-binding domain-containing protein|nr:PVC-type heme-binding CxxCH protein [Candidatus Limnocylindria bacterium]
MPFVRSILVVSVAAGLSAGYRLRAADPDPFAENVRTTAPLPPVEQQAKFHLPPGFEVQLVAAEPDINKPMNLSFDALGRLWVTTSVEYPFPAPPDRAARDRLMIFSDFDATGRAKSVTEFANGLNVPIGVYPFRTGSGGASEGWKVIVWSIPNIWLLEDTDNDGKADKKTLLYGKFDTTRDTHGNLSSFHRGFDGWLYGTHGFNNDSHVKGADGHEVHMNSGNTWRATLDGLRIEHHTHGQVNPFGLSWDARGNLYSSDCHSAPIYQLLDGGYYPSFGKPNDGLGFAPVMMEHAHGSTAIDGALYYNDDLWPAEFADNFFIGNVMTSRLNRDHIVFHGSSPSAVEQPDFLTTDDPWFRPVDNQLGPDGAIYVADFYNRIIGHYEVPLSHPGRDHDHGRIWRVVYKNPNGEAALRPVALKTGIPGLVEELGSPNLTRRMLAANELSDRFGWNGPAGAAVRTAFDHPANSFQKIHTLWLLMRWNQLSSGDLDSVLTSPDATVRVHAQRVLASSVGGMKAAAEVDHALAAGLKGLADGDALVRRCAAEVLGTVPRWEHVKPLLQTLAATDSADTHLIYVLRKALRDHMANPVVATRMLSEKFAAADVAQLQSVAMAVPSPESAAFLLRTALGTGAVLAKDAPAMGDILRHAARYAPESDLGRIAGFAQKHYGADVGSQLDLFQQIDQGLQQRGIAAPASIGAWGQKIATGVLLDGTSSQWHNEPLEAAPTRNPWDFQTRRFSDGTEHQVLSSFPRGEKLTGRLVANIVIPSKLSFWLAGHDGPPDKPAQGKIGVRLLNAKGEVLQQAAPPRNDVARKISWDLSRNAGEKGTFEVTDGDTGDAYAWVALGGLEGISMPETAPASFVERAITACNIIGKVGWPDDAAIQAKGRTVLRELAATPGDAELRVAAFRSVAASGIQENRDWVAPLLEDGHAPASLREVAGVMVAQREPKTLVTALKSAPASLQSKWAAALASTASGAGVLLEGVAAGNISARLLQEKSVRDKLTALKDPNIESRVTALTRELPAVDVARVSLIAARRNGFDATHASAATGEKIFQQNCAVCHQINGQGGLVGPQLTGVGNRGLDRLCEDILDPNRNVDRAFRQTVATLKDGDTMSGLFRREEGELLVFANATGQEFSLKKADVASRRESELSLMPDNFSEVIPNGDFNHLLAYLLSQTGRK